MNLTIMSLVNIVTYAIRDILTCFLYGLFTVHIFGGKYKKKPLIVAGIILSLIATAVCGELFLLPLGSDGIEYLEYISVLISMVSVFILTTGVKKITLFLLTFLFGGIVDLIYSFIYRFIPDSFYVTNIAYIAIYSLMIVGILSFVKKSHINILPEVIRTVPRTIIVLLILIVLAFFCRELGFDDLNVYLDPFLAISILGCASYFIYKIFHLTYQQNEILKQMHDQKEYSEKMLTGDENLRRFRHDYRNHMIVINSLLESGRTDRAREYLNNMNSDISSTLTKISTGNFISDALINNKAVMAAEHDVSIKFTGQVIPTGIADEDLCTIFANILDNAIEATQKLSSNKTIRIDAALRNGFFIMNISNPVENEVKIRKDGTVKTTKKNQHEHGIGMKNVQKVVRKYNGSVNVTCENKVFSVDIMMKPTIQ